MSALQRRDEDERAKEARFQELIMPHLDAAYNLARWLTGNGHDAQDVVQETFLRAYKFFGGFRGGNSRSWLLSIVRNTAYSWLHKYRKHELCLPFDEEIHEVEGDGSDLEVTRLDQQELMHTVERLPVQFREILILRELEGLSYKEIAEVAGLPVGTVMSRLARARKELKQAFTRRQQQEVLK